MNENEGARFFAAAGRILRSMSHEIDTRNKL
ncbi:predicted protein [Sclerotinia sclerotiorum 1980 UF-70]|uniref:Uncharacterized protein n=1 Tax=Sclerotinia sclerotiorum (strain ATCC 18683 / 1980 / Ss-1) TaxID=665079 RepID=A7EX40_SCLS1|nr:predicted protein [Sclerotinia sclerotiorum 1980 UF-70]EDN94032.1 predicted protein [Sclerotinia sclerotiorum 1980 UF-70]